MRIFQTILIAALLCCVCGCSNSVAGEERRVASGSQDYVAVYYFHGNFRCINCTNFEKFTKKAVDKFYSGERAGGKLSFEVYNVEKKENEHFAGDYALYTKSVIVSLVKGGKEVKWKNLSKIWELARNEEGFVQYIKSEVDDYLKEL